MKGLSILGPRKRHGRAWTAACLVVLAALTQPPPLSAAPAAPSPEQLAQARDYVVTARFVEMLDGMINRFAANAINTDSADDLAMKRRIVRDMSREVMTDSLARSLAAGTPIEVLRAGAAYAKSDVGRIEFGCLSRWSQGIESYPDCIKARASAAQLARIEEDGADPGVASMNKLLRGKASVTALNASTRDLIDRDPELAAQLADYCKRKPGEGMCGYRNDAGASGEGTSGEDDERR